MKTKIVNHIAGELQVELLDAQGEADNLRHKYPDVFVDKRKGAGLDLAVLTEKLAKAVKLVNLLT